MCCFHDLIEEMITTREHHGSCRFFEFDHPFERRFAKNLAKRFKIKADELMHYETAQVLPTKDYAMRRKTYLEQLDLLEDLEEHIARAAEAPRKSAKVK